MAAVSAAHVDAEESRVDRAVVARWRAGCHYRLGDCRVDQAPTEDDIAHIADSILAGAFTGDFAVALERAAAFTDVVALGLRIEARNMIARLKAAEGSDSSDSGISAMEKQVRTKSSRLMHTAGNLFVTAKDFRHGANLWRRGKLE